MSKKIKPFRAKAIRKAIKKNPYTIGLTASLVALAAAALRSPRVQSRARQLTGDLKQRLSRMKSDATLAIQQSSARTEQPG